MMPKLQIVLIPEQRCQGCGQIGYVDEKQMLCCGCMNLRFLVAERTEKLRSSVPMMFWTDPLKRVSPQLADHIRKKLRDARKCGLIRGAA
jgi:hypothetical protein